MQAKGFTLLELLIVIAIIAILATILVIVINPVETLRRARDVQRLSDLASIRTAVALYLTVTPTPSIGTCAPTPGSTSTMSIYYSSAISTSTVAGGVDVATSTTPSQVDASGWVPVNLSGMTGGSPLSAFPLDPVNTVTGSVTASTLVYRYACADSPMTFEVDARLESIAFGSSAEGTNKHQTDGGNNSELYEIGTNLNILPSTSDF